MIPFRKSTFRSILGLVLLLAAAPVQTRAEIYRWTDERGTVNFTDDLSNVPAERRKEADVIVREPARDKSLPAEETPPPVSHPPPIVQKPAADVTTGSGEGLRQEIEQLRARIAAKENLITSVDDKRSLSKNPLRNRFVDKDDLDLYDKYKVELPSDRERLAELEAKASRSESK